MEVGAEADVIEKIAGRRARFFRDEPIEEAAAPEAAGAQPCLQPCLVDAAALAFDLAEEDLELRHHCGERGEILRNEPADLHRRDGSKGLKCFDSLRPCRW